MNWKFWAKPSAEESRGVLFGISPPTGCHFRVSNNQDRAWHVEIVQRGETVARGCDLIGVGRTDEQVIVAVAKRALVEYPDRGSIAARACIVRDLEGCYPPKNTNKYLARGLEINNNKSAAE
jgi:hypothetical protein